MALRGGEPVTEKFCAISTYSNGILVASYLCGRRLVQARGVETHLPREQMMTIHEVIHVSEPIFERFRGKTG